MNCFLRYLYRTKAMPWPKGKPRLPKVKAKPKPKKPKKPVAKAKPRPRFRSQRQNTNVYIRGPFGGNARSRGGHGGSATGTGGNGSGGGGPYGGPHGGSGYTEPFGGKTPTEMENALGGGYPGGPPPPGSSVVPSDPGMFAGLTPQNILDALGEGIGASSAYEYLKGKLVAAPDVRTPGAVPLDEVPAGIEGGRTAGGMPWRAEGQPADPALTDPVDPPDTSAPDPSDTWLGEAEGAAETAGEDALDFLPDLLPFL
nr:hypothetical protein [Crucivirus sp.]